MKVFLFYGYGGHSQENWFPWLKDKLNKKGHEVIIPKFPTPENQNLKSWLKVIDKYQIDEDAVLVGHSTGSVFVLNVLERLNIKVNSAHMVAPFRNRMGWEEIDNANESFFKNSFDYNKIKNNCNNIYVYYSDNDPYIPQAESIGIANDIDAKKIEVKNAGHFNIGAGFTKFKELYKNIVKN